MLMTSGDITNDARACLVGRDATRSEEAEHVHITQTRSVRSSSFSSPHAGAQTEHVLESARSCVLMRRMGRNALSRMQGRVD
jgi:hypothetical protein